MTRHIFSKTRLMLSLGFLLLCGSAGRPQQNGSLLKGMGQTSTTPLAPELSPAVVEKQEKARNDERQKRLVADTDRLLALATKLHEDVGKTDKNTLSLDVIKRADEIEKLAHSVKERMRG